MKKPLSDFTGGATAAAAAAAAEDEEDFDDLFDSDDDAVMLLSIHLQLFDCYSIVWEVLSVPTVHTAVSLLFLSISVHIFLLCPSIKQKTVFVFLRMKKLKN